METEKVKRVYEGVLQRHLAEDRQMIFISGPRQVGKTTLSGVFSTAAINWDDSDQRRLILAGEKATAEFAGIDQPTESLLVLALDEIHHYKGWKNFLKGLFDSYQSRMRILVTGSARLDVYKKGGDSLMGRYFPYRMHPLSVGELLHVDLKDEEIRAPSLIPEEQWSGLWSFGGFPEPFARRNRGFLGRWQRLRLEQLVRGDIRNSTKIVELDQVDSLARILLERSGEQVVFSSLAGDVRVSEVTVREWISTLNSFYLGFYVRPWSKHVANALKKTPKWYSRDWSYCDDEGKRAETFVACHLLKAVEFWTDCGLGEYNLYYIRDRQKNEVDFLVSRGREPWFLVEVKTGDTHLSPTLKRMQDAIGAKHAFQVVLNLPHEQIDCFTYNAPVVVPAKTFLSQLV